MKEKKRKYNTIGKPISSIHFYGEKGDIVSKKLLRGTFQFSFHGKFDFNKEFVILCLDF